MSQVGSYAGDYLEWSDHQLVKLLEEDGGLGPMDPGVRQQTIRDVEQILAWRREGNPAGWPPSQMPKPPETAPVKRLVSGKQAIRELERVAKGTEPEVFELPNGKKIVAVPNGGILEVIASVKLT